MDDIRITRLRAALVEAEAGLRALAEAVSTAIERDDYDRQAAENRAALSGRPGFDAAAALARGEDRPCPECRGRGYRHSPDDQIVADCASCAGTGSEAVVRPTMDDVMAAVVRGDAEAAHAVLRGLSAKGGR